MVCVCDQKFPTNLNTTGLTELLWITLTGLPAWLTAAQGHYVLKYISSVWLNNAFAFIFNHKIMLHVVLMLENGIKHRTEIKVAAAFPKT